MISPVPTAGADPGCPAWHSFTLSPPLPLIIPESHFLSKLFLSKACSTWKIKLILPLFSKGGGCLKEAV